jgi:hypothetical protein
MVGAPGTVEHAGKLTSAIPNECNHHWTRLVPTERYGVLLSTGGKAATGNFPRAAPA